MKLAKAEDYTIRHAAMLPIQLISGQATLSYKTINATQANTATPYINDAGVALSTDVVFFNQTVQKLYPAYPVGQKVNQIYILTLGNTDVFGYV